MKKEILKNKNRTLIEMHVGIILCGIICQIIGSFFVKNQWFYASSLWFGIVMAMMSSIHMHRTLDRALSMESASTKLAIRGYVIRYIFIIIIMLIIVITEAMNPLVVFMGYMSLKVTALFQPLIHKLCNKIFHEED